MLHAGGLTRLKRFALRWTEFQKTTDRMTLRTGGIGLVTLWESWRVVRKSSNVFVPSLDLIGKRCVLHGVSLLIPDYEDRIYRKLFGSHFY